MQNPAAIDLDVLESFIKENSGSGIDDISNLKESKVYVFHGTKDSINKVEAGQKAAELYTRVGADVRTQFWTLAEHGMVTKNYGSKCDEFKHPPAINNCGFDLAFEIIDHLTGE